jgi:hypothetical protein
MNCIIDGLTQAQLLQQLLFEELPRDEVRTFFADYAARLATLYPPESEGRGYLSKIGREAESGSLIGVLLCMAASLDPDPRRASAALREMVTSARRHR